MRLKLVRMSLGILAANGILPWALALLPSPPGEALLCLEGSQKHMPTHLSALQTRLWLAESKIGDVALLPQPKHTAHMLSREHGASGGLTSDHKSCLCSLEFKINQKDGSFQKSTLSLVTTDEKRQLRPQASFLIVGPASRP